MLAARSAQRLVFAMLATMRASEPEIAGKHVHSRCTCNLELPVGHERSTTAWSTPEYASEK